MSYVLPSPDLLPSGDRRPAIDALQVAMIVLSTSAVLLRFMARRASAAGIWWDDWLALTALIPCVGINISNFIATSLGLGKHLWDVPDHGRAYLKSLFTLELMYTTSLALNKLAVLLFYQRLFAIERTFMIAVKVLAAIVIAWWIGVEVATFLQCQPISKFWENDQPGRCINIVAFIAGSAIPNVVTDIVILLLPQPLLWKLRMTRNSKIALCGIFLLGAFTAISSIGRLVAVVEYHGGADFTWDGFAVIVWYSLEPAIGIICACLPCLGPLFRKFSDSPFASHHKKLTATSGTDFSRTTGAVVSKTRSSRLSVETASIVCFTEADARASIFTSSSKSLEDGEGPGDHELNVIHVRSNAYATAPITP